MYSITPALALGLALVSNAAADFSVYTTYVQGPVGGTSANYAIFSGPPDCSEAEDSPVFVSSKDLSSSNGIRCSGDNGGCAGSGGEINELEMRRGDMHWTYYGDSGDLVDTDNNLVGNCRIDQSDDYNCNLGIGLITGDRILFCETDQTPNGLGN